MNEDVELSRNTWNAAIKLAAVVSLIAVAAAVIISATGDVPQAAVVLPVIVVAFVASWIQTGRAGREPASVRTAVAPRHGTRTAA
jgi:ABC-type Mn2+/Zn2+ transport system permease subunit